MLAETSMHTLKVTISKPAREPYPEVQVTYDIMYAHPAGGTQINSVVHMRDQRNTKKGLFFETKCNSRES